MIYIPFMVDLLEIRTLGALHMQWRSATTALTLAPREAMLLIYLAYQQLPLPRHTLYDLLWPDEPRPRAQGNLRKLLMDIRRSLGDLIVADREMVTVKDSPHSIWLDVHKFKWHMVPLAQAQPPLPAQPVDIPKLIEGVKLYRGDFLADLKTPRSYLLSAWVEQEQHSLRQQMLLALRTLVTHFSGREQYGNASNYAKQLLQLDPLDALMVGELMRLQMWLGEREQALTLFRSYRQTLRREQQETPGGALEQLYQEIRSGIVPSPGPGQNVPAPNPSAPSRAPLMAAAPRTGHAQANQSALLPKPLTPLLGRDELLAKLQLTVQDPTVRLISLVGMGGIGKTHLALALGEQLATQAVTDVAFISLERFQSLYTAASVNPASERAQQLTRAIADVFSQSMALDEFMIGQLLPQLHNRDLLLILDYFDPFVAEADLLGDLLQNAPRLKLLITARESLQLPGEVVLRLPGLAIPALVPRAPYHRFTERRLQPDPAAARAPAIELFIHCVKRREPAFTLQDDTLQRIEQICRLVEGHPLAIELAAGLVQHYCYAEIVELLTEGIEALSVTGHGLPRRQQSVVVLLAEAWQQLPTEAKTLLHALTVFDGSFSRKAAVTVAGASLELLSLLVNRSWLLSQKAGRYLMPRLVLHFLRRHATDRQDLERQQQVCARHADYYLSHFLEEIASNSAAAQGKVQFVFVEDEGNITGALRWALQYAEPQRQAACQRLLPLLERAQWLEQKRG